MSRDRQQRYKHQQRQHPGVESQRRASVCSSVMPLDSSVSNGTRFKSPRLIQ
jgi:hypothetical protein